jgi:hypothetical protein
MSFSGIVGQFRVTSKPRSGSLQLVSFQPMAPSQIVIINNILWNQRDAAGRAHAGMSRTALQALQASCKMCRPAILLTKASIDVIAGQQIVDGAFRDTECARGLRLVAAAALIGRKKRQAFHFLE